MQNRVYLLDYSSKITNPIIEIPAAAFKNVFIHFLTFCPQYSDHS